MGQGIAWTTIHQTLVRKFAFAGSYDAVKRFLRHHKQERPATVMLDCLPAWNIDPLEGEISVEN